MTRYPRGGKGRHWTTLEMRAIAADWKGDTISDGDGLSGAVRVASNGQVSVPFRYAFRQNGKVAWYYCGAWPSASLEDIRKARDWARGTVKRGVDPRAEKKATRIKAQAEAEAVLVEEKRREAADLPFSAMFEAWLVGGVARVNNNAELRRSFAADVLPVLGEVPVRAVTDAGIRDVVREVGRVRGHGRAALLLLADLKQLFRWAEKRQPWRHLLAEGNPAELVEESTVVQEGYVDAPRSRILSPAEIQELRDIFAGTKATYQAAPDRRVAVRPVERVTQLALWICLSTACRIGELLQTRWEHVNLETSTWLVPAADTKTKSTWTVFLSPFALRQFRDLHGLTGDSAWCFPAKNRVGTHVCLKSVSKQVGDRQKRFKARTVPLKGRREDDSLVLAGGANGAWTPHDLRRTAATMMQQLGVVPTVIDRCQNHVLAGSKVRRHYLHYSYDAEAKNAWAKLGEELEKILSDEPRVKEKRLPKVRSRRRTARSS